MGIRGARWVWMARCGFGFGFWFLVVGCWEGVFFGLSAFFCCFRRGGRNVQVTVPSPSSPLPPKLSCRFRLPHPLRDIRERNPRVFFVQVDWRRIVLSLCSPTYLSFHRCSFWLSSAAFPCPSSSSSVSPVLFHVFFSSSAGLSCQELSFLLLLFFPPLMKIHYQSIHLLLRKLGIALRILHLLRLDCAKQFGAMRSIAREYLGEPRRWISDSSKRSQTILFNTFQYPRLLAQSKQHLCT